MARGKKKETMTPEDRLQAALVPEGDQPYKVPENWCWIHLGELYQINPKNLAEDFVDAAFIPMEKIAEKIALADALYVGGGDTLYMLDVWKRTGMIGLILDAYERGTVLAGLSAGAICWFKKMYTDSDVSAQSGYAVHDGIGLIDGIMTPHYGSRREFDGVASGYALTAYAAEDDAAIVFKDGLLAGSVTSGGKAYRISSGVKEEIPPLTDAV